MPGCFRPNATPLSAKHTPFKTVDLGDRKDSPANAEQDKGLLCF